MKRTFTYPIHHEMAGMTIQSFLKQQQYSSQVITHLKRTPDGICRNGVWARVHEVLQSGDLLTISIVEETSSEHIALPLTIQQANLFLGLDRRAHPGQDFAGGFPCLNRPPIMNSVPKPVRF